MVKADEIIMFSIFKLDNECGAFLSISLKHTHNIYSHTENSLGDNYSVLNKFCNRFKALCLCYFFVNSVDLDLYRMIFSKVFSSKLTSGFWISHPDREIWSFWIFQFLRIEWTSSSIFYTRKSIELVFWDLSLSFWPLV